MSSIINATGATTVTIDAASFKASSINQANITFYYSDTYAGSGVFSVSDWTVMGTETAAGLEAAGFNTGPNYKRNSFNINPTANFYVAVRVERNITATTEKIQWRFDNIQVTQ